MFHCNNRIVLIIIKNTSIDNKCMYVCDIWKMDSDNCIIMSLKNINKTLGVRINDVSFFFVLRNTLNWHLQRSFKTLFSSMSICHICASMFFCTNVCVQIPRGADRAIVWIMWARDALFRWSRVCVH